MNVSIALCWQRYVSMSKTLVATTNGIRNRSVIRMEELPADGLLCLVAFRALFHHELSSVLHTNTASI